MFHHDPWEGEVFASEKGGPPATAVMAIQSAEGIAKHFLPAPSSLAPQITHEGV